MKWSRWITWLGVAIALAGIVIAVWLLVLEGSTAPLIAGGSIGDKFTREQRLQDVALGLSLVAAGALLAVAAQIMGMMQANRAESN